LIVGAGGAGMRAAVEAGPRARTAEQTDWLRIAELYGELARIEPSPIVELNRAVAIGMAFGPAAGLANSDSADMVYMGNSSPSEVPVGRTGTDGL